MTHSVLNKKIGLLHFVVSPCRMDWTKWFAIGPLKVKSGRWDGKICGVIISTNRYYMVMHILPRSKEDRKGDIGG